MRYKIEIKLNGCWETKSWANTYRMAELQVIAAQKTWANFGEIETRIIDTDRN
jgi:hypothetical protein